MARLRRLYIGLAAALLASGAAGAAELYKWVDENGVTNYSNNPPPKSRTNGPVTIVEDRVSVYTPEKSVTDALEKQRNQKPPAPPPNASLPAAKPAPPPPPPIAYDPCMTPGDPNCHSFIYDSSPVFQRRRVGPPHDQRHSSPPITSGTLISPRGHRAGESRSAPQAAAPVQFPRAGQTKGGPAITEREREWERDFRDRDFPRR